MKRSRRLAAAAVVMPLFLFRAESSAQKPSPSLRRCQSVWVTAPSFGEPARRARKPLHFSAREILDLEFQVVVPAAASSAALELKVFTPNGHLYQELYVPPTGSSPRSSAARRKPRYRTLTAPFPVAGTTIVNSSLYGTWRVEAYLDGERSPCAKPRAFVLKP